MIVYSDDCGSVLAECDIEVEGILKFRLTHARLFSSVDLKLFNTALLRVVKTSRHCVCTLRLDNST